MNRARYIALAVLLLLQAGDLLTTWVGIHTPGLQEIDGTNFGMLVALKLVVTAVATLLCWQTQAAWVVVGAMAVVYVPVIVNNERLIWGG